MNPMNPLPGAKELHEGLKRAIFEDHFAALFLFDLDGFQQINTTKGKAIGDQIIALIEASISERGWKGYRIGGDRVRPHPPGRDLRPGGLQEWDQSLDKGENGPSGDVFRRRDQASGKRLWPRPQNGRDALFHGQPAPPPVQKKGRDQILWLPDEPVDSGDTMKIMGTFYKELARINVALAKQMEIESRTDFLTGLYNRRGFEDIFRRLAEASRRNNNPMALLYMDSDTLKQINDTKGHDAGDRFIIDISRVLGDVVRGSDFVSRWGADEFAVIVDHTTQEKALALARRIHRAISDRTEGTMSIGVYCGVPQSTEEAVKKADEALYRAKNPAAELRGIKTQNP
ncbi:MAG: diguanylate cyclase [Candidatus Latescibacteria bacterium]|nr:diguanylate cyclase [Candidatus Latescibacterota bacterium]